MRPEDAELLTFLAAWTLPTLLVPHVVRRLPNESYGECYHRWLIVIGTWEGVGLFVHIGGWRAAAWSAMGLAGLLLISFTSAWWHKRIGNMPAEPVAAAETPARSRARR